jgi:histidine ammonia-lyase
MKPDLPHQCAVTIGNGTLTLDDITRVARDYLAVANPDGETLANIHSSAGWVDKLIAEIQRTGEKNDTEEIQAYYSINTGFGALAGKSALRSEYLTKLLTRNLVTSHSVGVGDYFDEEVVRAAMLIRANSLARGYSGVRPLVIEKLVSMLNQRIYPAIPSKGSLGASGDLAPLAHLALVLSCEPHAPEGEQLYPAEAAEGEGFILLEKSAPMDGHDLHLSKRRCSAENVVWKKAGGEQVMAPVGGKIELRAKEGLALTNGATFSAALAALILQDARMLLENAELALAMTLEAIGGFRDPFFPQVHALRGHPGPQQTAARVMALVEGSQLLDPADQDVNPQRVPPQDPYSVRCAPQVIGTVRDTLDFVQRIMENEINAATDNPLIFMDLPRSYKTVSCGNFHGEPIAMAMDFLGIAITELGSIAERRVYMLTDFGPYLDSFLIKEDPAVKGLNSGLMLTQYTAASLVSDCKTLAHPDSVDSIPSSANKEDHVSMSLNAARHAREIVDNIEAVVAIELLCAAQALDLRRRQSPEARMGKGTAAVLQRIRSEVDGVRFLSHDRVLYGDIQRLVQLIRCNALVDAANGAD